MPAFSIGSARSPVRFPARINTADKVVALTFDDGPNEPYTSRLVDLLGDRGVCATFFQVGRCAERYPGLTGAMHRAGHTIANHSYSHQFFRYLVEPSLRSDVARAQQVFEAEIGCRPALFRPPWLFRQSALLTSAAAQGMQPVSGTFAHPLEVAQMSAWLIARQAVASASPGAILIFHDGFDARGGYRGRTVDAVRRAVDELAGRGFRFVTVDELLGVPAYQAPPAISVETVSAAQR